MKYYELPDNQRQVIDVFVKLMRAANSAKSSIHDHLKEDSLTDNHYGVFEALYNPESFSRVESGEKMEIPGNDGKDP